jgi:hypothetical protein
MVKEMVKAVKDHAARNYNQDGWDIVIESCTDEEIEGMIEGCTTCEEAITAVGRQVKEIWELEKELGIS